MSMSRLGVLPWCQNAGNINPNMPCHPNATPIDRHLHCWAFPKAARRFLPLTGGAGVPSFGFGVGVSDGDPPSVDDAGDDLQDQNHGQGHAQTCTHTKTN